MLPFLSCLFLPAGHFFYTFFQKILQYFSFRDRLFCMAPVQQLGKVRWSVVCAACQHMTLVFAVMHLYNTVKKCIVSVPPKGGQGCLMSPPCLESQGCHLIPLCYLLSCSSAQSFYSLCLIFFCLLVRSSELFFFSPENSSIFFILEIGFFCMAPVQQLGEVSWSVVCEACCHMALVFAVMHLYN